MVFAAETGSTAGLGPLLVTLPRGMPKTPCFLYVIAWHVGCNSYLA